MGFEVLEHPADLGLKVWGQTLESLIEQAVPAMTSVLFDLESIEGKEKRIVEVEAPTIEHALYQLLSDVLFFFDAEKQLYSECKVDSLAQDEDNVKIKVVLSGEKMDMTRHHLKTYVKAVTYHQLEILQSNGNYQAKVFLDI